MCLRRNSGGPNQIAERSYFGGRSLARETSVGKTTAEELYTKGTSFWIGLSAYNKIYLVKLGEKEEPTT